MRKLKHLYLTPRNKESVFDQVCISFTLTKSGLNYTIHLYQWHSAMFTKTSQCAFYIKGLTKNVSHFKKGKTQLRIQCKNSLVILSSCQGNTEASVRSTLCLFIWANSLHTLKVQGLETAETRRGHLETLNIHDTD